MPEEPVILSDDELWEAIEKRPMKVVAATIGSDEHSVGLREIIDIKHGGIEKWGIEVEYLGTSCPVEKLVDAAIETNSEAILASTIISHDEVVITSYSIHYTKLYEDARGEQEAQSRV